MSKPDLLALAVALAHKGYRVLPLAPLSRVPKGLANWQHKATSNTKEVRELWKRLPRANVGITTGYTFLVIDVDVKHDPQGLRPDKHGLKSLSELRAAHHLPKTLTVKTPSGGLHLYYKHPCPETTAESTSIHIALTGQPSHRPIKNVVDWKLPIFTAAKSGIDIRAEGGQVVAPGMEVSDFPGRPYEIVFDIPMADLPDSLVSLLPYKEIDHEDTRTGIRTETQQSSTPTTNNTEAANGTPAQDHRLPAQNEAENRELRDSVYSAVPDYARGTDDVRSGGAGLDLAADALVTTEEKSEYSTLPASIPAGGRDDALFRFMCSWRERGYPLAHAEILAKELHVRLEQPANDKISLSDVLTKLRRTYKTYQPSAIDAAAVQELRPETTLEDLSRPPGTAGTNSDTSDTTIPEITLEPQQAIQSVVEALTRFVLCIEGNSVVDTTKHPAYANIRMESFKSAYGNVGLKTSSRSNAKIMPLPKLWLEHTNRQTVDDYGYRPNGPKVYEHLGTRFYNKWAPSELFEGMKHERPDTDSALDTNKLSSSTSTGFNGARNTGDGTTDRTPTTDPSLKTFWNHLDFLFDDDEKEKQAFWTWLAYSIRYPERRVAHGVLIVSEPGVGKSWFYKLVQKLLGVYEINTAGNNELESSFNGWVYGCSMVVIHELKTGNKRHMMQQLLSLITDERILINEKHKTERMRDIYANFLCFSNHGADAAAVLAKDRRFFVYQSAASKAPPAYYKNLFDWLETDGPLHLLQYIHSMDLSKFNPGEAPMHTAAKALMEHTNMSIVEQAIDDAIEDRQGPFAADIVDASVVEKYLESIMDIDQRDRTRARTAIANRCPPLKQVRYRFTGDHKQYRLRSVRDGKRWSKAEHTEVTTEFAKALEAMSLPVVKLESVK